MLETDKFNEILSSFKIKASCVAYEKIKHASFYDLVLEPGTQIGSIQKFANEIALRLKAKSKPVIKSILSDGIVRVEVLNELPAKIQFFDEFRKSSLVVGQIPAYLGITSSGKDVWMDLSKNPHLLIAGCTGSGKSTLLHVLMANLLMNNETQVSIIDMKNEFSQYQQYKNVDLATDYNSATDMVSSLCEEMDYRYSIMKNKIINNNIVLVIDEFADIIMQDNNTFSELLCRLSQKSRAAGIYCVVATQRPSFDIISGVIKANFPARISCQVSSSVNSRIIIDQNGAENLLGNGDAIIHNYNHNFERFQIACVSPEEILNNA